MITKFSFFQQAVKEATKQEDCDVYNEILRHVFMLNAEDVNEVFTLVQALHEHGLINLGNSI